MTEKRIDIRWRDLDALGHVNQAVYQTYGEEIVDAWFRDVLDLPKGEVWDYVVVKLTTDYRSELRLDDEQVAGSAAGRARWGRRASRSRSSCAPPPTGAWQPRRRSSSPAGIRSRRAARPISDDERAKLEAAA